MGLSCSSWVGLGRRKTLSLFHRVKVIVFSSPGIGPYGRTIMHPIITEHFLWPATILNIIHVLFYSILPLFLS